MKVSLKSSVKQNADGVTDSEGTNRYIERWIAKVRKRRLKFYGHIPRTDDGEHTKQNLITTQKQNTVISGSKPSRRIDRKLELQMRWSGTEL